MIVNVQNEMTPETGGIGDSQDKINIGSFSFKNVNDSKSDKIYYIRLGHLLDWIQDNIIPNIRNKNGTTSNGKIIKINTDSKTNIIHLEQRQIITDPRICVFKTTIVNPLFGLNIDDFSNTPQSSVSFTSMVSTAYNNTLIQAASKQEFSKPICSDFEEGEFLENDNRYLYLMNTYFSMSWILNKMDSIADSEGNIILLDFLQSLCDGFASATCFYNKLVPTVNEHNEILFIDEIALPDRDSFLTKPDFKDKAVQTVGDGDNLAKFNMFGYKENESTFIRDFSFRTEIPSSFATMITVGAQARGLVVGEDATCLSKMNYGLTDRMKPEIIDADIDLTVSENQQLINNFFKKTAPIVNVVFSFLDKIYEKEELDSELIDSMKNIGKDLVKLNATIYSIKQAIQLATATSTGKALPKSSPGSGFIPFNLQLTMDGLSGFKIYQKYTAEQEFLPTNYPESLDFIIKGITHNIENNQWTTVVESLGMPRNPEGSGYISPPTPPLTATSTNTGAARALRRTIAGEKYTNGEVPENLLRPINNMAKYKGVITSDGGRIRLYEKASIALDNLIAAAEQAKIPVKINSAYRTFSDQQRVYNENCPGGVCKIRTASPGTSNHGFGLAVDFATPGLARIKPGDKLYDWLAAGNGAKFGFKRIASESWHWEYQQT